MSELKCICNYCGNEWTDEADLQQDKTIQVGGCKRCVPTMRKGIKVRYNSPERCPQDKWYADKYLKPDETYTVDSIKRWQHGAYLILKEVPRKEFHLYLFTPSSFKLSDKKQE